MNISEEICHRSGEPVERNILERAKRLEDAMMWIIVLPAQIYIFEPWASSDGIWK